jgi:putative intracellular protease/amidase
MDLNGKKIAILATNGFEQAELEVPRDRLKKAGAAVDVVSLAAGEIKGWDKKDWGRPVKVDKTLDQVSAGDYDAIVLPGGQINPDLLRVEPKALQFIKDIFDAKKVVAAVCHAPWLLIETGDDVLQIDQDRRRECRRQMGGLGGRCRSGRHHVPQSGRLGSLQRQDHRGGQGRPP